MTTFDRTALFLAAALFVGTPACSSSSAPPIDDLDRNGESAIRGQVCNATPAPNARCASPCSYGYEGPSGTHSCTCCAAPASRDAGHDAGETCGNPPPNARCMACPGGSGAYKQINGQATCECCTVATPDAGHDAGEICGGPPANARCMACPGGGNGYKQIDGQPTCQCCSE